MSRGTVHIVDDDAAIGRALALLARSAGLEAKAHISAEAFLHSFDPETTACVVTDVKMPGMSGLELHRAVRARDPATAVVIITGHGETSMAVEALKGGAADFIEKPFDDHVFLNAVREATATTHRFAARRRAEDAVAERVATLSYREREVMDRVVAGQSSPAIAKALGISVRTVESHRARVMDKMGATSLAELVRMALQLSPLLEPRN